MLAGVSGEEAQFLRGVFRHARKGRTWLTLNTAEVSQIIGQPRDRIVAVLGHLEEKGDSGIARSLESAKGTAGCTFPGIWTRLSGRSTRDFNNASPTTLAA